MRIYYDSYHEGVWFRGLHSRLEQADLQPFSTKSDGSLGQVLQYDRPDVVLVDDNDIPLLVLERTIEVPSGHNVGQRFALGWAQRCPLE